MATRKKLPATLAVAALTATLYGCGGGGDNRFVDLEDQLGTALTAESLKKLQDEKKAAEDERDKAKEKARMDVAAAEEKRKMDVAAAEEKRRMDVADAEEKGRMAVADAEEKGRMAVDAAVADAEEKARIAVADAEEKGRMDVAAKIRGARVKEVVERAVNADVDLPFTIPPKASRENGMVTIELSAENEDDPFPDGESAAADGSADGRWTSVRLMRDRMTEENEPDKSDTIIVYTDVEAPTPFTSAELLEKEGDGEMFVLITGGDEGSERTQGRVEDMELDNLPTVGSLTIFPRENAQESHPTFNGKYEGIDGTFTCVSSSGCTISAEVDGDGAYRLSLGGSDRIRFVPDDDGEGSDTADMKYTYFGWWEETDEDDLGRIINLEPFNLEPFSGGSHPANITSAMTGTAKYTGKVSGKYAMPIYEDDVLTDGEIGTFEAAVTLNASFRAEGHLISGKVVDFMTRDTDDTMTDRKEWSVELSAALIRRGDGTDPHVSGDVYARFDDHRDDAMRGDWEATFYNSDDDSSSDHPDTITGIFDASAPEEGILTGGFGAKTPEPEMDMPPAEQ